MANRKISDLTALTTPATGDLLPIVDISEAAAADKNKKITFGELFASILAGTAAAPSVAFEGDSNTGIYSSGADQLAIATNGTERMRLDSSGFLGLGTSSPGARFHVNNSAALSSVPAIGSLGGLLNATVGTNDYGLISGALNTGAYFFQAQTTNGTSATYPISLNPNGGNVGIGTTSPTTLLDVSADTIRVRTARTPASASATGATGEICWDANYIYVCTAANTWKRTAIATW